jgi:formylglycine-generating enzyme required for sulfatase activity
MNPEIRANLRDVLAHLYRDTSSIERIIADSGMDLSRIVLASSPSNNWHAVLTAAENIKQIDVLLDVVEREYRTNTDLQNACKAYREALSKPSHESATDNVDSPCFPPPMPTPAFSLNLSPKQPHAIKQTRFAVEVHNQSSHDLIVHLSATDPHKACIYTFESAQTTVLAGQSQVIGLTVRTTSRTFWQTQVYPFMVTASAVDGSGLSKTVQGKWHQLPQMWPALVLVVTLVSVALVVALVSDIGVGRFTLVAPQDRDVWVNPVDQSEYVYVSEGEYTIGATAEDVDTALRNCAKTKLSCKVSWYTPTQQISNVHLDGFWIKRTEVTNEEYGRCVTDEKCDPPLVERWGSGKNPVTNVTWRQANQYAQWVKGRLPTEAEWEVACRGRSHWVYPWGNEPPGSDKLNYKDSSGGRGEPREVGSYPAGASPYGVLDMLGNVQEWTNSLGGENYPYNATDGRENPASEGMRVVRGWSYAEDARLTCFTRGWLSPNLDLPGEMNEHRPKTGFRVVISGS